MSFFFGRDDDSRRSRTYLQMYPATYLSAFCSSNVSGVTGDSVEVLVWGKGYSFSIRHLNTSLVT